MHINIERRKCPHGAVVRSKTDHRAGIPPKMGRSIGTFLITSIQITGFSQALS